MLSKVDLVFPTNSGLEGAFRQLKTVYYTGRTSLVALLNAELHSQDATEAERYTKSHPRIAHALSTDRHIPDVWSLERTGSSSVLNLNVGKQTFEGLGMHGKKVHDVFKGCEEQYQCSIKFDHVSTSKMPERDALARWDRIRESAGQGQWEFSFCADTPDITGDPFSPSQTKKHEVEPTVRRLSDVRIPTPDLSPRPESHQKSVKKRKISTDLHGNENHNDALDDWMEQMTSLFEWVGMAALGSQRLLANDNVDPYVAVYSAPESSTVGDVSYMRWQGFLDSDFVMSILECAILSASPSSSRKTLCTISSTSSPKPFVAFIAHGTPYAPRSSSMLVPRTDGEDTWSVVLMPDQVTGNAHDEGEAYTERRGRWAMVESIGRWNARFG
ncbi:hypothetical protein EW146_g5215 [Bondarzewia mesenterica]|uniref:Uncharacterized protein n=1 Tax=Bondarzewia mesenterica TaxID=1095465 RepID=A0A4S4LS88_9AGAM|nr:hypothetical protein EW146_g5215 [Bondarzewia mesenterica]